MPDPIVSFEFFPPNDEAMAQLLWQSVQRLAPLQPRFVSVTYGADGSTRTRTHECVLRILRETNLRVAPHLTCVAAARAGGFAFASDLVGGLKQIGDFELSVAAFPEGHPESGSIDADLENLKRKIDAGANRAITQFFFDTDLYLRYRDRCVAAGIRASIVPGILPITRFPQMLRVAARCGASVPEWMHERFDGLDDDPDTRRMIAANVAIEQVQRLRQHGVQEFHFYTLNRAELTYAICHALGLRPRVSEARVA